jgi:hypothetical protein
MGHGQIYLQLPPPEAFHRYRPFLKFLKNFSAWNTTFIKKKIGLFVVLNPSECELNNKAYFSTQS